MRQEPISGYGSRCNNCDDNQHLTAPRVARDMQRTFSVYLDLLRFLAALVVLVYHACPVRLTGGLPALWRIANLADAAVILFFVLSGFVIAYVADQKEPTLRRYSVSRLTRLYSVALPAIALTLVVDIIGTRLAPSLYTDNWFRADNPLWRIAANLLFLNEIWFTSVSPFSNTPFWSLGYEFWYYAIFAAAFYLRAWHRVTALAAVTLVAGPKILLLLPVWLAGVGAYYAARTRAVSEKLGAAIALGSVVCYAAFRLFNVQELLMGLSVDWLGMARMNELHFSKAFLSDYVAGLLFALHLIGISAVAARLAPFLPERPIRYLAGFTFALYLFHFPLLHFFAAVAESTGTAAYKSFIVPIGTVGVVWALGELTERRKPTVRRWVVAIHEVVAKFARSPAVAPTTPNRREL